MVKWMWSNGDMGLAAVKGIEGIDCRDVSLFGVDSGIYKN